MERFFLCVETLHIDNMMSSDAGPGPITVNGSMASTYLRQHQPFSLSKQCSSSSIEAGYLIVLLIYASGCPFSNQMLLTYQNVSRAFPDLTFLQIDGIRVHAFTEHVRFFVREENEFR